MASFRALTVQSGVTTQQQNGDILLVGSGIDTPGVFPLTIGDTNANAVVIGQSASPTQISVDPGTNTVTIGASGQLIINAPVFQSSAGNFNFSGNGPSGMSTVLFPGSLISISSGGDVVLDAVTNVAIGTGGLSPTTAVRIGTPTTLLSFFGLVVAQPKQPIAGVLSAVVDPNAKAVLTSIIDALKSTGTGYGLVDDTTT